MGISSLIRLFVRVKKGSKLNMSSEELLMEPIQSSSAAEFEDTQYVALYKQSEGSFHGVGKKNDSNHSNIG